MNLADVENRFKAPFPAGKIKWRVQSCGKTSKGKLWARVLAYHTSRLVMDRLDDVVGMDNWKDDLEIENGHVKAYLTIRLNDIWVTKTGVAEETNIEAIKGGASDALKRAGVKFGIGRYLYKLEANFPSKITENKPDNRDGWNKGKVDKKNNYSGNENVYFYWKPPSLPSWAIPNRTKRDQTRTKPKSNKSLNLSNIREAMEKTQEEQNDTASTVSEDRATNFAIWWGENIEGGDNDRYRFLSKVCDRKIESTKNMTESEMDTIKSFLEHDRIKFIQIVNSFVADGTQKLDLDT